MDPDLESPVFWSSFHTRLMVAIADTLAPELRPKYYIDVETRTYQDQDETKDELLVTIKERYLEVRELGSDTVITVIEVLSPTNKHKGKGQSL